MARVFLSAQWRDLILASYAVDSGLLLPRLPDGLELDLFEGQAVCSLVGFRFQDTRVFGIKWPGYRDFPEINLRFYVREKIRDRRGVVFVRELVQHRLVREIAYRVYNEPYVCSKIEDQIEDSGDTRRVRYRFEYNDGIGDMSVEADADASVPSEDSTEHWFKEHQWGYGTTRGGRALLYEVQHPHWGCHRVLSSSIEVDWARIYGEQWAHMVDEQPLSVVLAEGSAIKVFGAQTLGS